MSCSCLVLSCLVLSFLALSCHILISNNISWFVFNLFLIFFLSYLFFSYLFFSSCLLILIYFILFWSCLILYSSLWLSSGNVSNIRWARLAQSEEHQPSKLRVVGSSPTSGAFLTNWTVWYYTLWLYLFSILWKI